MIIRDNNKDNFGAIIISQIPWCWKFTKQIYQELQLWVKLTSYETVTNNLTTVTPTVTPINKLAHKRFHGVPKSDDSNLPLSSIYHFNHTAHTIYIYI